MELSKAEFNNLYHEVKNNLYWVDVKERKDIAKHIENKYKFKFLDSETLSKKIEVLKKFDINKVWDKSFWGLSQLDSISAVASEPYLFLKKIKSLA